MNDKPDIPVENDYSSEADESELLKGITYLLNTTCAENASDTPDFILAEFLLDCLSAFNKSVNRRNKWYKPNETTMKTFEETDEGKNLHKANNVGELFEELDN